MCAEDQDNWDDYVEQVLGTYRGVPNLTTGESPFFLVYGRDGNQPLHQLLQPLTRFLGDPDSGLLCLDQHRLSLCQEIFGRPQIPHCRKDNGQSRTRIQSRR